MKVKNGNNWINIEFIQYATEQGPAIQSLIDEDNCIEIYFNYNIENDGWGSVCYEFFNTKDIKAIATGFSKILFDTRDSFEYSGYFPYENTIPSPFYTFNILRTMTNGDLDAIGNQFIR